MKLKSLATAVVHAGEIHDPSGSHTAPIYQTSTFTFDSTADVDAYLAGDGERAMYTRTRHPARKALARKIAALEGHSLIQEGLEQGKTQDDIVAGEMFASGMGAIGASLMGLAKAGDHIIAQDVLYGTSEHLIAEILPHYEITATLVPKMELGALEQALDENKNTKAVFLESPANPTMTVVDIEAVCELAHSRGAQVIVDNTFATPVLQRPLELGADIVVHSTTKYLNGHGTALGGAVVCRDPALLQERIYPLLRTLGAVPSPFDLWLTNLGLKTLHVRLKQHCENARQVAAFLDSHPKVSRVLYPGLESFEDYDLAERQMADFGAMMSFEVEGGMAGARAMLDRLELCTLAVSLGTVDTLLEHPASMTHTIVPREKRLAQGITDGLVRISVGIEAVEDIIGDLEQALS